MRTISVKTGAGVGGPAMLNQIERYHRSGSAPFLIFISPPSWREIFRPN